MAKRNTSGKQLIPAARGLGAPAGADALLDDVRSLIRQIGRRIRTEVLKEKRAGYGEEICSTPSNELAAEFGTGFSRANLFRMIRFAEVFPEREIVSTLSRQLGWSHFVEIIPLKNDLQRDFYAEMCRVERWSVRARLT
jgi:hypothetical protein